MTIPDERLTTVQLRAGQKSSGEWVMEEVRVKRLSGLDHPLVHPARQRFGTVLRVGGSNVNVRGAVVDGIVKISAAFQ
ncbi:MAG TPA: hypothetical protein DIW77_20215 [Chromatiaceae bacterium]|jgi:hypothetical protein|nr:MAG: hypothetical protein N838_18395 [Thiohalocapsa sp. PB-PSB1]HCS92291.1 hypothetical protein [Chromatiaceae bacterium]